MGNAELIALLREARESLDGVVDTDWIPAEMAYVESRAVECIKRIDSALATCEAEERVEWTPLANGKAFASEVNGYRVTARPAHNGLWEWWTTEQPVVPRERQHGYTQTKETAQEAAIAAARGMR